MYRNSCGTMMSLSLSCGCVCVYVRWQVRGCGYFSATEKTFSCSANGAVKSGIASN